MTVRITVDVFSGRPNPTVVLTGALAWQALQRSRPAAGTIVPGVVMPLATTRMPSMYRRSVLPVQPDHVADDLFGAADWAIEGLSR